MRRQLFYIIMLFTVVLILSCKKQKHESIPQPPTSTTPTLTGQWEWSRSNGGWGNIVLPDAGTAVLLNFFQDSSYSLTLNSTVKYNGQYKSSVLPVLDMVILDFDADMLIDKLRMDKTQAIMYFKNDTCMLSAPMVADGYTHIFKKKK